MKEMGHEVSGAILSNGSAFWLTTTVFPFPISSLGCVILSNSYQERAILRALHFLDAVVIYSKNAIVFLPPDIIVQKTEEEWRRSCA